MPERHGVWRQAGDNATVTTKTVDADRNVCRLAFDLVVPAGETKARLEYDIYGDGVIDARVEVDPSGRLPSLPRVGMQCQIDKGLDEWTWYGRGPWENYRDRNTGSFIGIYSGKVGDLWHPYLKTQENSNRTGVRWASFVGSDGTGLRFESADEQALEVGAYPVLQEDLEKGIRSVDLVERDSLTVHVANAQMGVGGEDSWGARTLEEYQLPADRDYHYAFRIIPVR